MLDIASNITPAERSIKLFKSSVPSKFFTLVAGLSSSGKSTWLAANASKEKIILPFELGNDFSKLPEAAMIHYNTLRFADNNVNNLGRNYKSDPFLVEILRHTGNFSLVYIAATREELLRRIDVRRTIENGKGVYPQDSIAMAIRGIDHPKFHADWLDLLVPASRDVQFVLSEAGGFRAVSQKDLIAAMTPLPHNPWLIPTPCLLGRITPITGNSAGSGLSGGFSKRPIPQPS